MQETLVNALRFRSPDIRERWAALLQVEPVTTPLAHPHALVHLIDWTLNEIFLSLLSPSSRRRFSRRLAAVTPGQSCCGRNPLLAYFSAGEQAMREALILVQVATSSLDPVERDASLEELNLVLDRIGRREIEAFCGVCQHRSSTVNPGSPCRPDRESAALAHNDT